MQNSDKQFNFDLEKMKSSIESGTISLPPKLNHQERMDFIKKELEKIDKITQKRV